MFDSDAFEKRFQDYHSKVAAGLKATNDKLDELTEAYARIETAQNRPMLPGAGSHQFGDEAGEGLKAVAHFARTGDMSRFSNAWFEGDDTSAGYANIPVFSSEILTKKFEQGVIGKLARNVILNTGSHFIEPVDVSDADASWVGETEARPETSAGNLKLNDVPLNECYANVKLSQSILDDVSGLGEYVLGKLKSRFARLENAAFITGTGHKQPMGILSYPTSSAGDSSRSYGSLQYVPTGASASVTADSLIALHYSLAQSYRQNGSTYVMSSDTLRALRTLKSGDGSYLIGSLTTGGQENLLGRPIAIDESMPAIAANSFPIAFASWQDAYIVVERPNVKFLHDPYSAKPFVQLYCYRRIGGQSTGNYDALKLLKVATS